MCFLQFVITRLWGVEGGDYHHHFPNRKQYSHMAYSMGPGAALDASVSLYVNKGNDNTCRIGLLWDLGKALCAWLTVRALCVMPQGYRENCSQTGVWT